MSDNNINMSHSESDTSAILVIESWRMNIV